MFWDLFLIEHYLTLIHNNTGLNNLLVLFYHANSNIQASLTFPACINLRAARCLASFAFEGSAAIASLNFFIPSDILN